MVYSKVLVACMFALPHFLTISSRLSIVWFLIQFFVLGTFSFLFVLFMFIFLYFYIFFYILFFIFYPFITRIFIFYFLFTLLERLPQVRRSSRTAQMFPAEGLCLCHVCILVRV
jgi:hypothetical protein